MPNLVSSSSSTTINKRYTLSRDEIIKLLPLKFPPNAKIEMFASAEPDAQFSLMDIYVSWTDESKDEVEIEG